MRLLAVLTAVWLIAPAACAIVPAGSDQNDKPEFGRTVVMETNKGNIHI